MSDGIRELRRTCNLIADCIMAAHRDIAETAIEWEVDHEEYARREDELEAALDELRELPNRININLEVR